MNSDSEHTNLDAQNINLAQNGAELSKDISKGSI